MNYNKGYNLGEIVKINGDIFVPKGYKGDTNIIVPDEIVKYCAEHFGLLDPIEKVIDPMCGVGTIPRVINSLGGNCIGIEIDENRYLAAAQSVNSENLILGDFREVYGKKGMFKCIFTSMPFIWFRNVVPGLNVDQNFALKFAELLKPDGFVLLDSIPIVERDRQVWPVASLQSEYLNRNGFMLETVIIFDNKKHIDTSPHSVVMKFNKTRQ